MRFRSFYHSISSFQVVIGVLETLYLSRPYRERWLSIPITTAPIFVSFYMLQQAKYPYYLHYIAISFLMLMPNS